jgi:hypothetical protein
MNPEQDNYQAVQRLLALKRHEQPPPGYFENFSAQIIARIQAGERSAPDSFWEWLSLEASWLHRLWVALETKPVFAGALGAGVCGLLLAGVLYSQSIEPAPVTGFMSGMDQTPGAAQAPASAGVLSQNAGYDLSTTGAVGNSAFRSPVFPENQSWSQLPTLERANFTQPVGSQ